MKQCDQCRRRGDEPRPATRNCKTIWGTRDNLCPMDQSAYAVTRGRRL